MDMDHIDWMRRLSVIIIEYTAIGFFLVFLMLLVVVIYMYIADITQTEQTVRRNYPVIGRFRYLFEHMGEFFRQYFFAQDREELPFNRAFRSWVYRASKNIDSTIAFGSTRPLNQPGHVIFLNAFFPVMKDEATPDNPITLGDGVAWAMCIGADFVVAARGFKFSLGCIQALQCNKNTCPTGITTHNKDLQKGLVPADKARRVEN